MYLIELPKTDLPRFKISLISLLKGHPPVHYKIIQSFKKVGLQCNKIR